MCPTSAPWAARLRAVNEHKAIAEIREVTSISFNEARDAARSAVLAVGGLVEPTRREGGMAAGRRRVHHGETWWVPKEALH